MEFVELVKKADKIAKRINKEPYSTICAFVESDGVHVCCMLYGTLIYSYEEFVEKFGD